MKLKSLLSLFVAILMAFSTAAVSFAEEVPDTASQFGDVLYADEGIVVFYGNPDDNEELAEEIENQYARSALQYDGVWVDAHTSTVRTISIDATSSNPLTYFNIKQEADSPVTRSRVTVQRPNNDGICYTSSWDGRSTYQTEDMVISTSTRWNQPFFKTYPWKTGTLKLTWTVETGNSGARINMWAW